MSSLTRGYEAMMILRPELSEETVQKLQAQFQEAVTRYGGKVVESVSLGKRRLSYRIRKADEGIYLQTRIQLPPGQLADLKLAVALFESVMRPVFLKEDPALAASGSRLPGFSDASFKEARNSEVD